MHQQSASLNASQVDRSRPRSVGFAPACLCSLARRWAGRSVGPVAGRGKKKSRLPVGIRGAPRVCGARRALAPPHAVARAQGAAGSCQRAGRSPPAGTPLPGTSRRRETSQSFPATADDRRGWMYVSVERRGRPPGPATGLRELCSEREAAATVQARAFFVSVPASGFLGEKKGEKKI